MSFGSSRCWSCGLSLSKGEYVIKSRKAIHTFLLTNPQWQKHHDEFGDHAQLCARKKCMAIAYESWRLDTFGIKSPRSPRTSLSPVREQRTAEDSPGSPVDIDEGVASMLDSSFRLDLPVSVESTKPADSGPGPTRKSPSTSPRTTDAPSLSAVAPYPPKDSPEASSRRALARQEQRGRSTMTAEQFERLVAERRELVTNISSRSTALDAAAKDIGEKLLDNRVERLRVAKRIDHMTTHGGDRERRQRELKKELATLRKRELYERMLAARMAQEDVQNRIEDIEKEQLRVTLRLEEAARVRQEAQDAIVRDDSGARKKAVEKLGSALEFMKHVPETKGIVGGDIKYLTEDNSSGAITKSLQLALRESYIKQKEEILSRRRELTAGRFELEARLEELRAALPANAMAAEDEPFDSAFELAETMPEHVEKAIGRINRRVIKAAEEVEWLEETPATDLWYGIRTRMEGTGSSIAELSVSNARLKTYFEGVAEKEVYRVVEDNKRDIDNAALLAAENICVEWVQEIATTMCSDYLAVSSVCQISLDQALLRAITGADSTDVELMRVSGREFLYLGAMNDLRLSYYRDGAFDNLAQFDCESIRRLTGGITSTNYTIHPSQPMVDSIVRVPDVMTRFSMDTTKGEMPSSAAIDSGDWVDDFVSRQPVVDCEEKHWCKFSLMGSRGSPILLPNVPGHTACLKLFPHAVSTSSLLVIGTDQGQLAVYLVPWTGMAPTLLSVTPQLPRKLKSPVIDVREAPCSALHLISMTLNGHVRVWQLATVPSSTEHSSRMFPRETSKFEMLVPTCLFHINPLDTSMPVPLDPTGRATAAAATALAKQALLTNQALGKEGRKKKEKKAQLGQTAFDESKAGTGGFFGTRASPLQGDMFPSVASFHPSMTILGRNPSIMVGTAGGDLVKFNMDFKVDALDAPIAYLPAFLNIEFVHPVNSPETILLTSSGRKGNQVYRELFHFHKSRVILLTVVGRLSDLLFSMDEEQNVALWRYEKELFMGMCWFRPLASATLDLSLKTIIYVGDVPSMYSEPSAEMIESMRVRQRYLDNTGALIEIFSLVKVGRQTIEYQSRTSTFTTATMQAPEQQPQPQSLNNKQPGISTPPARATGHSPPQQRSPSNEHQQAASLVTEEVTEVSWSGRFVRNVAMQTRVEGTALSADGTELAIAVSYRKAPPMAPGAGFESVPLSAYKSYISIVSYHLETMEYQHPFPVLEIAPRDAILSFTLSPILSETLTRVCIIHTRLQGLRVFSMETGEEIVNGAFPFVPKLPSFEPALFSTCPSLRVLAFGGPQDARIAVYVFMHEDDGKEEEELKANIILTPEVLGALRRDFRELDGLSTRTVLAAPIAIDTPEQKAAKEAINDIIDEVFDLVMEAIQRHIEEHRRLGLIADVYGANTGLGRVRPTHWLGDSQLSLAAEEESDDEEREILGKFLSEGHGSSGWAQAEAETQALLAAVFAAQNAEKDAALAAAAAAAARPRDSP